MRVLHVICDLAGGGAERLVLDLCRRSVRAECAVAPLHRTGALRGAFEEAGVPVLDLDRRRGRPGARAALRLARLSRDFDVVHTHLWAGDTWGRLGAALARHPCVLGTEHNTRAEAAWRQRLSVALHPLARVVVCVSEGAAQVARQAGVPADKLRVVHNGVDLSGIRPRLRGGEPLQRVLGIGRLAPQKGFDLLADAVAQVPGLSLELLGEGEAGADLARRGARLLGWADDVRPHLERAQVVAVPSRWEGFGLVAVEAMAAGVPVVASDVPGLSEVVGDAALRVPAGQVEPLAQALRRLRDEPGLRARLSAGGPAQAGRFAIERTVQAYEDLYDELLTGS